MKNKDSIFKALLSLSLVVILGSSNAESRLLQGYVKKDNTSEFSLNRQSPTLDNTQSKTSVNYPLSNSFPKQYLGTWNCVTTVVNSSVNIVEIGNKTISTIVFQEDKDSNIIANWNQPQWTQSQSNIVAFNDQESQVERTNYYWGENMQGAWATRSKDTFKQVNPSYMTADSEVDQYYQGQYIGRYKTQSVLYKANTDISALNIGQDIASK